MVGNVITPGKKESTKTIKVEENRGEVSAKEYIWWTIFLKRGEMQRSRRDTATAATVNSPRICCLLSIDGGKNNAFKCFN